MGKLSRNKGASAERNIVNLFKSYGVDAKRISMMESGGIDKGDVEIAQKWTGEVKIGKQTPLFLYKARKTDEEFLFCRRDREKWLVVADLEWFIKEFL